MPQAMTVTHKYSIIKNELEPKPKTLKIMFPGQ